MKLRGLQVLQVIAIIVPILLIISPNFIQVIVFEEGDFKKIIGRTILFLALFLSPLVFFYKNIKWYFYLLFPFLVVSLSINYLQIYLKASVNVEFFLLLFDSNKDEALEFLTSIPIHFLLASILSITLYFICIKQMPKSISFQKASISSVLCLFVFFLLPIARFGINNYRDSLSESTRHFYPFNIFIIGNNAIELEKSTKDFNSITKNFLFHSKKQKNIPEKEIHILFIGEASRRDHWGIYGYYQETSPYLNCSNVTVYSDAISSGYMTNRAVPIMFTGVSPSNFSEHTKRKGILSAFKEAGFVTYYISTQSNGAADIDIHAREGDYYIKPIVKYEEELKTILLTILSKERSNKIFLIFHTSGSHWRYDLRYPASFNFYKPSMKDEFVTSSDKSKRNILVNTYDNTILYSDFVLHRIIKALDSINVISTLTFISDHGENLLDDNRNLSLHAQATKVNADIPLFIWTSKSYELIYPEKTKCLKDNKNKKVSTENIFYSVLDLADIKIKDDYSTKSFISYEYKEHERFVITENGIKSYSFLK